MPLVTSKEIITQANLLLNDKGYVRWPLAELLGYLSAAQKAIVLRRPDAYTVDDDSFTCVAGTKQRLPDDALRLIDIPRNSTGMAIRGPYDRNVLDNNYPDWYAGNSEQNAELYLYDPKNPKTFYVYPGIIAGAELTVVYSKVPPKINEAQYNNDETIALDDIYENALLEWVMYRCYSKDAEYAADPNKAMLHLNAFKTQLGEKSQADSAMTKNTIKE